MTNINIRTKSRDSGVRLWEVAEKLGVSEWTLIRRMRHELPDSDQQKILGIIDEIISERLEGQ